MNTSTILKPLNKLWDGVGRRVFVCIPNTTVNTPEICNKIGVFLSRPDVNRGVMGATAILTQPLIDYYNPDVDEETAKTSTCRTIGKIIAGTMVGCAVRFLCYQGTKGLTSLDLAAPDWRKVLLPSKKIVSYLNSKYPDWILTYRNGLANFVGLAAMLFTNVLLDVPLTNKITKKLLNKFNLKTEALERNQSVESYPNPKNPNTHQTSTDNPKQKIYDSFEKLHEQKNGGDK